MGGGSLIIYHWLYSCLFITGYILADARAQCARLRWMTSPGTSATTPIMMRFSKVSVMDKNGAPALPWFQQDLAAFLLIRSEYAWLGYSWGGCNRKYTRPVKKKKRVGKKEGKGAKNSHLQILNMLESRQPDSSVLFAREAALASYPRPLLC